MTKVIHVGFRWARIAGDWRPTRNERVPFTAAVDAETGYIIEPDPERPGEWRPAPSAPPHTPSQVLAWLNGDVDSLEAAMWQRQRRKLGIFATPEVD